MRGLFIVWMFPSARAEQPLEEVRSTHLPTLEHQLQPVARRI